MPNDNMLMWLLARLDPKRFALRGSSAAMRIRRAEAAASFGPLLDGLTDTPPDLRSAPSSLRTFANIRGPV
jgi:hypothetical protein